MESKSGWNSGEENIDEEENDNNTSNDISNKSKKNTKKRSCKNNHYNVITKRRTLGSELSYVETISTKEEANLVAGIIAEAREEVRKGNVDENNFIKYCVNLAENKYWHDITIAKVEQRKQLYRGIMSENVFKDIEKKEIKGEKRFDNDIGIYPLKVDFINSVIDGKIKVKGKKRDYFRMVAKELGVTRNKQSNDKSYFKDIAQAVADAAEDGKILYSAPRL